MLDEIAEGLAQSGGYAGFMSSEQPSPAEPHQWQTGIADILAPSMARLVENNRRAAADMLAPSMARLVENNRRAAADMLAPSMKMIIESLVPIVQRLAEQQQQILVVMLGKPALQAYVRSLATTNWEALFEGARLAADLAETAGPETRGGLSLAQQRQIVGWYTFAVTLSMLMVVLLEARLKYDDQTTFFFDIMGVGAYGVAMWVKKAAERTFDKIHEPDSEWE